MTIANVATSGYLHRMEPGIRKLKDNFSRWDGLIAAGIHPSVEAGDPFEDWPDIEKDFCVC